LRLVISTQIFLEGTSKTRSEQLTAKGRIDEERGTGGTNRNFQRKPEKTRGLPETLTKKQDKKKKILTSILLEE